jgi:hypothetical protein
MFWKKPWTYSKNHFFEIVNLLRQSNFPFDKKTEGLFDFGKKDGDRMGFDQI